jgi:AraC-like DNA-binding protein
MTKQEHNTIRREGPAISKTSVVPERFIHELKRTLVAAGIFPGRPSGRVGWCVAEESDSRRSDVFGLPERVGRVILFIEENLERPLSLDRLSAEAELSKYYFARLFREEVGQSPWAYVRHARLEKAKTLLEQGASPAAAALESGFFDQSHLMNVMCSTRRSMGASTRSESRRTVASTERSTGMTSP